MIEPVTTLTLLGYFVLEVGIRVTADLIDESSKYFFKKLPKPKNSKISEAEKKYWKAKGKREEQALELQQAQLELQQAYLDWLREQQAVEIDLAMEKIQADYDKEHWAGILSRNEMVNILVNGQKQHRLLVIVSEPEVSPSCPRTFADNLPRELRGELKKLLDQLYPLNGNLCPVEFYGKFFKTAVFDTQIKQLETVLSAIPTVVIYSEMTDEKLFLYLHSWGLPIPLSQVMIWDWETVQERLQADGMLEKQSLKQIRQEIVSMHQFLAAFLADIYYLSVNPFHEPRLFQLVRKDELLTKDLARCLENLRHLQDQRRADYEEELRLLVLAEREEAYELGKKYDQQGDDKQAVFWYRKAAEQGQALAQYNLGWKYVSGRGVNQDDKEAIFWFRKAAQQGVADAQHNLGWMYEHGRGVTQDNKEAVFWYRKAAEQGQDSAQCNLGDMYERGCGLNQDDKEAVFWYRKAAEQGQAVAQYNLGRMYAHGRGVAQDNKEAIFWYRKAAEQGDAPAQYNLGWMYLDGRGATQDDREAAFWWRKAAEQGVAEAQYNLGLMYQKGRGVTQDNKEAVFWYRKAAEQGDEGAKKALQRLGK